MEDSLLDMNQEELLVKETQRSNGDSPATFSKHLVNCFDIIGHNIRTIFGIVNPTQKAS